MDQANRRQLKMLSLLMLAVGAAAAIVLFALGHSQPEAAQASGPVMSLGAAGNVICNDGTKPTKCTAGFIPGSDPKTNGTEFTITLNGNDVPAISGFGGEVLFGGLTWNQENCANTVDVTIPFDLGGGNIIQIPPPSCSFFASDANTVQVGAGSTVAPPFLVAFTGSPGDLQLAHFNVHCPGEGQFKVVATANPPSSFGAVFFDVGDPGGNVIPVTKVQDQGGVDVADTLLINCVEPTPTPTITPTPTATSTPTATPTPTATSSPTPTPTPTPTDTATPTPLPSELADVTVSKADSADPVEAASNIGYKILVRNDGLETATGVEVVDTLPVGATLVSAGSSGASCSHNTGVVTCQLTNDLAHNEEVSISIVVTAPAPTTDDRITNTVQVSATNEPFINSGNNKDEEETVVLAGRPNLKLVKIDEPDPAPSDSTIIYTLAVTNNGPQEALNVVIKDNLPPEVTFLPGSSSPGCAVPVGGPGVPDDDIGEIDVICDLGNLSSLGQNAVLIAVAAPAVEQDLLLKNRAFVTADNEPFDRTGDNLAIAKTAVLAPAPDLTVDKSGPLDPVFRTDFFSYTLTITNLGLGDAFAVELTDVLPQTVIDDIPQPVTFIDAKGADCAPVATNTILCNLALIVANGGQEVITLNVRAPTVLEKTQLTNNVSVVDPDEPGDPSGNNSASADIQVQPCSDVTGDQAVTTVDTFVQAGLFGVVAGDLEYDLVNDLNGDGAITLFDIFQVATHFGEVC